MALPGAQCTLYLVRRQRRRLLFFFSFVVGHYDPSPALVHQPASPCYKGGVTDSLSLPDKILHCSRYSESRNSPLFSAASRNFERSYAAIIQFGVAGPRQRQKPATNAASATCTPRADRNQGFIARSCRPTLSPAPRRGPPPPRRPRALTPPLPPVAAVSPQSFPSTTVHQCSRSKRSTSPRSTSRTERSNQQLPVPPVAAPSWTACWAMAQARSISTRLSMCVSTRSSRAPMRRCSGCGGGG